MQVRHRFDVYRDHRRPGVNESPDIAVRLLNHQVHVEWPRGDSLDGSHDGNADGNVRHEMTVHDVDMDQIGTAPFGGADIASKRSEVGGENRRRDLNRGHRLTSIE